MSAESVSVGADTMKELSSADLTDLDPDPNLSRSVPDLSSSFSCSVAEKLSVYESTVENGTQDVNNQASTRGEMVQNNGTKDADAPVGKQTDSSANKMKGILKSGNLNVYIQFEISSHAEVYILALPPPLLPGGGGFLKKKKATGEELEKRKKRKKGKKEEGKRRQEGNSRKKEGK